MLSSKGKQYLLFILAALLIYRCSESTEPDSSNFGLVSLAIGNQWTYKMTTYDSTGNVINQQSGTRTIDIDTVINGVIWYRYAYDFRGVWNTNKSDGYWQFLEADTLSLRNDTSWIEYKFPTNVGDVYGNPEFPKEVLSVSDWISVPAGIFNIIHITQDGTKFNNPLKVSFERYICPGIGFVRSTQIGKRYDGTKYVVWKSELESYSIK